MNIPGDPMEDAKGWGILALVALGLASLLLFAGCGRKQVAIGAANITEAADAILTGADPMPAATGIKVQSVAIHRAMGAEQTATVPAAAWHHSPQEALEASAAQAQAIGDEAATWGILGALAGSAWAWLAGAVPVLGVAGAMASRMIGKWKGIAANGIAFAQRAKHAAEEAIKLAQDSDIPAVQESAATVQRTLDEALARAKEWQEAKGVRPIVDHLRREVSG